MTLGIRNKVKNNCKKRIRIQIFVVPLQRFLSYKFKKVL